MNPAGVEFEPEEIDRVNRIMMPKWMGGGMTPDLWDAMNYKDQCDALEVARAMQEIEKYEAGKMRSKGRRRR
jgi:hypothetical protein